MKRSILFIVVFLFSTILSFSKDYKNYGLGVPRANNHGFIQNVKVDSVVYLTPCVEDLKSLAKSKKTSKGLEKKSFVEKTIDDIVLDSVSIVSSFTSKIPSFIEKPSKKSDSNTIFKILGVIAIIIGLLLVIAGAVWWGIWMFSVFSWL